jgi:CheY-like chemotaxis protein
MPLRILTVDSRGPAGPDRARSRDEALQQITENDYDLIELHTARPGLDDYGLVKYLRGTWPGFLDRVAVRTMTPGRASSEWNDAAKHFIVTTSKADRRHGFHQPPHFRLDPSPSS